MDIRQKEEDLVCNTSTKKQRNRDLQRALQFVSLLNESFPLQSGEVLFLGTKDFYKDLAKLSAFKCNQSFINNTWKPGTLTNWNETEKRIKDVHSRKMIVENHINEISTKTSDQTIDYKMYESYLKKEARWGGLIKSSKEPRLIVCLNPDSNKVALREAQMRLIPTIRFDNHYDAYKSNQDHSILLEKDDFSSYLYYCNIISQHMKDLS